MFPFDFWSGSIAIRYASYQFQIRKVPTPLHYQNHAKKNMFQWKQKAYLIWKLEQSHSDPVWWKHSIRRISSFALYLFSAEVCPMPPVIFALSVEWRLKHFIYIYPGTIPFQYLKTVFAIQYSTLSLTGSQFIFLKWNGSIWDLGGKLRQKRIHLFWTFWTKF